MSSLPEDGEGEPRKRPVKEAARQRRIRELFMLAVDRDESQRSAWLDAQVQGDAKLKMEVLTLLSLEAGDFLRSPMLITDPEDLVGREVGGFRLERILGRGGMGVVFLARQSNPDRAVAVKLMRQFTGEEGVLRFEVEIQAAGKLDHPGIVRVISSGVEGELRWYAMDLVDGWPLQELMGHVSAGVPMPDGAPNIDDPRVCARLVLELALALQHAHDHQVVHRDVKPANLLIDRSGRLRLTDFGLARDLDRTGISATDQVAGTLAYMSPEQARALRDAVSARSDIYSAGAVFYALLSGHPPHEGSSSAEVLTKVLNDEPTSLRVAVPGIHRGLALIADSALRKDPGLRYPSAHAMAEDLERWLGEGKVMGRRLTVKEATGRALLGRRAILRAIPVAAAVGGAATYGGIFWSRTRQRYATVTLELGDTDRGARLLFQEGDGFGTFSEATEIGEYQGRQEPFQVPLRRGRLTAVIGQRSVAFDRNFVDGLELIGQCTTMPSSDPTPQTGTGRWVAIPSGSTMEWTGLEASQAAVATETRKPVDVAEFLVQQACVDQGSFRAINEARGRWSAPPLPTRLIEATKAREKDGSLAAWDRLPATSVSLIEARRYAEGYGWRLMTSAEWQRAFDGDDSHWWKSARPENFILGRVDSSIPIEAQATLDLYRKHAVPAFSEQHALGPSGLCHIVGNVSEWTTSPAPSLPMPEGLSIELVTTRGRNWFRPADFTLDPPFRARGFSDASASDWSLGFRCAKSSPPDFNH